MTFCIITTLLHTERRGKKGGKAKEVLPQTSSNKSLSSYLLRNGLSIETYFMWQALLLFFFIFIFWDIWHQSRRAGLALQLCFEPLPSSDYPTPPSFFVRACLFFVNAISIKSLLNSFFFGAGGKERKAAISRWPPHGRAALASREPEVPASQTDPINKEFGERSISACLCALNERQRLQRHAY